jgi:hypothetical protein
MSENDWIICERTGRWAAAMRVRAARRESTIGREPRIYEVRSLEELARQLEVRPASLALIEVHSSNLSDLLSWLAENSRQFTRAHFVALLDRSLCAAARYDDLRWPAEMNEVHGALLEAGAAEISDSPRRLQYVFAMAERHAAIVRSSLGASAHEQSIANWAWSQLPWQRVRE